MTVEDVEFMYEVGKFISEADGQGVDAAGIKEHVEFWLESKREAGPNKDEAINYLFQAVQLMYGYYLGMLVTEEQKLAALPMFEELGTLTEAAENELEFVTLTTIREGTEDDS